MVASYQYLAMLDHVLKKTWNFSELEVIEPVHFLNTNLQTLFKAMYYFRHDLYFFRLL